MIVAGHLNTDVDVLLCLRSYTPSLNPTSGTASRPPRGLSALEAYSKLLLEPNMHLLKSHQHLLLNPPLEEKEEQEEEQAEQGGIPSPVSYGLSYLYADLLYSYTCWPAGGARTER